MIAAQKFPLHGAVRLRRPDLLAKLIEDGYQVNTGNFDSVTPLHEACLAGDFSCVSLLIQAGAIVRELHYFLYNENNELNIYMNI